MKNSFSSVIKPAAQDIPPSSNSQIATFQAPSLKNEEKGSFYASTAADYTIIYSTFCTK